jgi:hypothetical protein
MESHLKERQNTPIWNFLQDLVVKPLMKLETLKILINEQFLQEICGILDVNTFELRSFNVSSWKILKLSLK